jgi:hypothetical protein
MRVRELIEQLQKCPPDMEVVVYDAEEDDDVPVTMAIYEDGATDIQLTTQCPPPVMHQTHKRGSCGGECGLCWEPGD